MHIRFPERIVCLTEEPVEVLYALGEDRRIVGISGFTVRPPEARRTKPKVSAFTSADIPAIAALEPDLVIGYSDLQADIARDLLRLGIEVWISNHHDVAGILGYVHRLGAMVGAESRAESYCAHMLDHLRAVQRDSAAIARRPRVYFEEWDEPMITAGRWIAELIRIAGGDDAFPEQTGRLAKERILPDPARVVAAAPELVFASWCGKRFAPDRFRARPGFDDLPAVRSGQLHEIDAALILQPGPAALTDGLDALHRAIRAFWDQSG